MRFEFDWPYVRRHSMPSALSALVALLCLVAAYWSHHSEESRFAELSANRFAVHEDYDALVQQRRLVDHYHRRYQRLHDLGFIGRENRLDWVETLRTASSELAVPRLTYSMEPQVQVVPPVQSVLGGEAIQLHASKVQLEMGLLHEMDLLRFFDMLQANAPGIIKVDACDLVWHGDADARVFSADNLSASCAIELFSVITSDVGEDRAPRGARVHD